MHSKTGFPRPSWRALQLLTLASVLLCVIVVYAVTWGNEDVLRYLPSALSTVPKISGWKFPSGVEDGSTSGSNNDEVDGVHPIEQFIAAAKTDFKSVLKTQATSLEDAAARYRKRRGRHPPPGFDAWYNFASEKGAVMVEEFWDQIHHDLGPFWGVEPRTLRQQAHAFHPKISIRDGAVDTNAMNAHAKLEQWADMLQTLASQKHIKLPDIDIPLSVNDEPAMLVPWETIDTTLSIARPILPSPSDILSEYSLLSDSDLDSETKDFTFDPEWLGPRLTHPSNIMGPRPFWSLIQPACPPNSPSRFEPILTDIWHPQGHTSDEHSAAGMLPTEFPTHTLQGYVRNWTTATNPCEYPALQGLHGAFVAPESISASQKLFPLFGASKMSMSNEILLPGARDWNITAYSPPSEAPGLPPSNWSQKGNTLFWHGPATGGHTTAKNWQRFHRHRFVSMLNATQVEIAEANLHAGNESTVGLAYSGNFRLLATNEYGLLTQKGGRLAEWVNSWADVAFTDLHCHGLSDDDGCSYNEKHFSVSPPPDPRLEEQEKYKYTAVVDGDGGDDGDDFLAHLTKGKVVLRASVYRNWYDSRLRPWLHFLPMDNSFIDLYGIMEYFLGTTFLPDAQDFRHVSVERPVHEHHFHNTNNEIEKRNGDGEDGHDAAAGKIAQAGKQWADRVLRKEDMLIYVYRLLLEYARVVDDKRERLGWISDLETAS